MKAIELPRGIKYKIIIDDQQAFHNANDGLISDDYVRIVNDLEKISKMPVYVTEEKYFNKKIKFGIKKENHAMYATLPYRNIEIICNTNFGSGRIMGYSINDHFCEFSCYSGKKEDLEKEISEWYQDATMIWTSGTLPRKIGHRRFTLKELDNL